MQQIRTPYGDTTYPTQSMFPNNLHKPLSLKNPNASSTTHRFNHGGPRYPVSGPLDTAKENIPAL